MLPPRTQFSKAQLSRGKNTEVMPLSKACGNAGILKSVGDLAAIQTWRATCDHDYIFPHSSRFP
jgi:hypothetical protein